MITQKAKALKIARKITKEYIEIYGASFNNIDELDNMIAEAITNNLRQIIESISIDTTWRANRYNTDKELVLHLWRDIPNHGGHSLDIYVEK